MNTTLEGHKLLVLLQYPPNEPFIARLKTKHPNLKVEWHNTQWNNPILPDNIWDEVTAVCTWNKLPTLEESSKLQLVQLTSSGANHCYGNPQYERPDVTFCTSNGIHAPQIAEWVFATFLSFQHHIPTYMAAMENEEWSKPSNFDIEDSPGLRIGILGYGAIGRQCARIANAVGMDIVVYTMRERSTPESRQDDSFLVDKTGDPEGLLPSKWFHGKDKESLNTFLSQDLDLLVISLPLTASTTNMIAEEQFKILSKKKTFISNIARGPIVNTSDLIDALETGKIRGAALDVTDPEPLPKAHPLWKAKNLFISPHISWHSIQHAERLLSVIELNLERLSQGKPLVNKVDKVLGF